MARKSYPQLMPTRLAPTVDRPLRIGIAPTPDFTLMPFSCFIDFLRLSADESDFSRKIYCNWETLSHDFSPIKSSGGVPVTPTRLFGDPRDYDYVVISGGLLHSSEAIPDALYAFIQSCLDAQVPVVGLCTGQFILAELGCLDGKRCAVHFSLAPAMREHFPKVTPVTDMPVVNDGGFITCPGGLAAINLAAHLVSTACGHVRSHKALHYLLADHSFDEFQTFKEDVEIGLHCPDRRVVNAVGIMRQKTYEPGSISEIAKAVGATERELTRLFQKHLRLPPLHYWRNMRLNSAKWMVLNSTRSISQIAYECGFTDSAHLVNWFKREFKTTPYRLRKQQSELGVH